MLWHKEFKDDEFEFIKAMEKFQRVNSIRFPTYKHVLDVIKSLGYRKVAETIDVPTLRESQGLCSRMDR